MQFRIFFTLLGIRPKFKGNDIYNILFYFFYHILVVGMCLIENPARLTESFRQERAVRYGRAGTRNQEPGSSTTNHTCTHNSLNPHSPGTSNQKLCTPVNNRVYCFIQCCYNCRLAIGRTLITFLLFSAAPYAQIPSYWR